MAKLQRFIGARIGYNGLIRHGPTVESKQHGLPLPPNPVDKP